MKADYNYENDVPCTTDFHFFRVFDCYDSPIEVEPDNTYIAYISGDCAWSVSSCMCEDGYYSEIKAKYPSKFKGITLKEASEILHCEIEVYSYEPGMEFAEHYYYRYGETIFERTTDYQDIWFGDYDTKEEAEEDLGIEITDDEWDMGEIIRCDWDFDCLEWEI